MALNERRLTGRDVLAKTFQAKTKRGYDPIEVDAYLELVAAQIDVLHGDIGRLDSAPPTQTMALSQPAPLDGEAERRNADLLVELQTLRDERDELAVHVTQLNANTEALRSENDQLRNQLTSIAPPPPVATPPVDAAPVAEVLPVADSDDRASEESLELVLRMARRSAEETIAEAHTRADEIVAEANLTASQIAKESDRKAYEAANKVQAELASITAEIETQQSTLGHLQARTADQRSELRDMAQRILHLADDEPRRFEGAEVVDLRDAAQTNSPA